MPPGDPGDSGDSFDNTIEQVPLNQGVFIKDLMDNSLLNIVASTWGGDGLTDFVYWGFTGRPPGVGHGDDPEESLELARWR